MKILVVDDEPDIVDYMCAVLRKANYEPKGYTDPVKALERFIKEKPSVVLTDLSMPKLDGVELCRRMREHDPKAAVPIVFVSVCNEESEKAYAAGCQDFLSKPIREYELLAKVKLHKDKSDLIKKLTQHNKILKAEQDEQKELIEKLKEAQAQLLQQEKMASIGQLAAGVAHEINNPVGYISSNLTSLESYVGDLFELLNAYSKLENSANDSDEKQAVADVKEDIDFEFLVDDVQELLEESKEGILRVKQIVNDLKDFSHVDEVEWQWADLHKGIDSTLNIVNNELKYKAEVIKDYGDLPLVECIPSQINQIVMNLCVNASHAIDDHGTISIKTQQVDDDHVEIQVTDTGKGISPENLKKIFEPFFTTKPVGQGTGLGLSLSFSIMETHNGKISATSEVGVGTTFKVLIPVRQSANKADDDSQEIQASGLK